MIRLLEKRITIKCLERDVSIIEKVIPECEKEFEELVKKNTQFKLKTVLEINKKDYLSTNTCT